MASKKPLGVDDRSSVSEIFSHPLPQVRQAHRSMIAELEEKNVRLRTLVGGSYRQLLGTAETIICMSDLIQKTEENLARVSQACGKTVIDHFATGLTKLHEIEKLGKHNEKLLWLTRIKTLDMHSMIIAKLLRENKDSEENEIKGKNLITAAKFLAVSKPLVKSVEALALQRSLDSQKLVSMAKMKLSVLRRNLLEVVEQVLRELPTDDREYIIQALIAYSLTTNTGLKNLLTYFLCVREDALSSCFTEHVQMGESEIVRALIFYTRTLSDTSKIIPREMSESLARLRLKPLLQDNSIKDVEELRLDELERWLSEDTLSFTPSINYEDLDELLTTDSLTVWAKNVSKVLLQGVSKTLTYQTDLKTFVNLRTKVFETWVREARNAKSYDSSAFLENLRHAMNACLLKIIDQRIETIFVVGKDIKTTISSWKDGITDKPASLWDESIAEMEVSNGAVMFKKSVLACTYGRNNAVSRALMHYQEWKHLIQETFSIINQMKNEKWDNDFEDAEDNVNIDPRSTDLLCTEDPQLLQQHLEVGLSKALNEFQKEIESLLTYYEDDKKIGSISVYVLRIIRDIRSELPQVNEIQTFGAPIFVSLYERLSQDVCRDCLNTFTEDLKKKRGMGRLLWEGDPELPVQPSPTAFKLLYNLTKAIEKTGQDLWSHTAVLVLKKYLSANLTREWNEILEKEPILDGDVNKELDDKRDIDIDSLGREAMIQTFFDFFFIFKNALGNRDPISESPVENLEKKLSTRTELDPQIQGRIRENAKDYWKKTNLLFSILS